MKKESTWNQIKRMRKTQSEALVHIYSKYILLQIVELMKFVVCTVCVCVCYVSCTTNAVRTSLFMCTLQKSQKAFTVYMKKSACIEIFLYIFF